VLSEGSDDSAQLCICLSQAAVDGIESPKSMRLIAMIQGLLVMMLVDSGNSHTSIRDTVAIQLDCVSALAKSLSMKVANGAAIVCSLQLQQAEWGIQGCTFHSDFKVIPLTHFDIILGYDWLEAFSPMKVH
jgi:hypothetical protein